MTARLTNILLRASLALTPPRDPHAADRARIAAANARIRFMAGLPEDEEEPGDNGAAGMAAAARGDEE